VALYEWEIEIDRNNCLSNTILVYLAVRNKIIIIWDSRLSWFRLWRAFSFEMWYCGIN